jgi:hypothetical protein
MIVRYAQASDDGILLYTAVSDIVPQYPNRDCITVKFFTVPFDSIKKIYRVLYGLPLLSIYFPIIGRPL